jgi:hypothetical protein
MSHHAPSCQLTTDEVDLHNPSETELLTALRAVAAGRDSDLRLAKAAEEFLEARAGSAPGLLAVRKKKNGPGREYLRSRRELTLGEAEPVFAAYLAGDPDFDRGLKWEVLGVLAGNAPRLLLGALAVAATLALLWKLGFRVIRVG